MECLYQSKKILGEINIFGESIKFEFGRPDIVKIDIANQRNYINNLLGYSEIHKKLFDILGEKYCQIPIRFTEDVDEYAYFVERVEHVDMRKHGAMVKYAYHHIAQALAKHDIIVHGLFESLGVRKTSACPTVTYTIDEHECVVKNPGFTVVLARFDNVETPTITNYDIFKLVALDEIIVEKPSIDA